MKIPVYQTQLPYRWARAQATPAAQPLRQAQGDRALAHTADLARSVQGLFAPSKTQAATSVSAQEKSADFSSRQRAELFSFVREKALAAPGEGSPVERLEQYAAQNPPSSADSFWAQDFAVLHRELSRAQQQQQQTQAQTQFDAAQTQWLQTAALIATPRALEKYLTDNLSAASAEAQRLGTSPERWQAQKKALAAQAVVQNVQAALQADQPQQAREVYRHFQQRLSAGQRALLQEQLQAQDAARTAQAHRAQAWQTCVNEEGEIRPGQVEALARRLCPQQPKQAGQLAQALTTGLRAQRKQFLKQQAGAYAGLFGGANVWTAQNAFAFEHATAQKRRAGFWRAAQELQAGVPGRTDRAVFGRLNRQIIDGSIRRSALDEAYEKGALSAADYVRLQQRACLSLAGEDDPQERLLAQALEQLCQRNGLDESARAEVFYQVFSGADTARQRWAAARQVRQILTLQEPNQ